MVISTLNWTFAKYGMLTLHHVQEKSGIRAQWLKVLN